MSPSSCTAVCASSPKVCVSPGAAESPPLTSTRRQPEQSTTMGALNEPSPVTTRPSLISVTAVRRKRASHCESRPSQKIL